MGGGNAQKSAAARLKNNAKKCKEANNKGSGKPQAMVQCMKCRQQFAKGTTKEQELTNHIENKHKLDPVKKAEEFKVMFKQCFPDWGKAAVEEKSEYGPDKAKGEKKKKYKKKG